MMDTSELLEGIALIIDDEIFIENSTINEILKQVDKRNIPYVKMDNIPADELLKHLINVSFVLLDWDLIGGQIQEEGVVIPDETREAYIGEIIKFISDLKEICFCPIFIFSALNIEDIETTLEHAGLYRKDSPGYIFVQHKSDLIKNENLFEQIADWINKNPSIYVLKEWEREYQKSKNRLFLDFENLSSFWPLILWKAFDNDGGSKSYSFRELLNRNLFNRMTPFNFSDEVLENSDREISSVDLCKVQEGERYIDNKNLHKDNIMPGDLFFVDDYYFLNIRAACDLIPNRNEKGAKIDGISLYLIRGREIPSHKIGEFFDGDHELFRERDNQAIVFPINNGKTIEFYFKNLIIDSWGRKKEKRIGRILPPYITRIQQRYSFYIQRQGLPRIPKESVIG